MGILVVVDGEVLLVRGADGVGSRVSSNGLQAVAGIDGDRIRR